MSRKPRQSQDDATRIALDPRLTSEAVRLLLYVRALGPGEHEIDPIELRVLLGSKGDKPVYAARDRAAHYGYLRWRRGGRAHNNTYELLAPQGDSNAFNSPPRATQSDFNSPSEATQNGLTRPPGQLNAVNSPPRATQTPEASGGGPIGGGEVVTTRRLKKQKVGRERAAQLPDEWTPNEKHAEIAREEGVSLRREAEKMRDWAKAKGEAKKDWDAAFRNWLRRARDSGGGARASPRDSPRLLLISDPDEKPREPVKTRAMIEHERRQQERPASAH